MTEQNNNPLKVTSIAVVNQMRKVMMDNGFGSPEAVDGIKLLDTDNLLDNGGRVEEKAMPPLASERMSDSLEILIKLLVFGASIDRDRVARAILPMKLDDWLETGLLYCESQSVKATLRVLFYRNLLFAVDFMSDGKGKNHVIGITPATQTLEMLTVRRPVGTVLDIGTGTGIQAMMAASHSDSVIATDVNARAVNVASFNACLSGLDIDCRVGSLFEPVNNETFDLIISCPPFVISPDDRFHYLDSGHAGDRFLQTLIKEGVDHLNEDGYLQVMCQIARYGDQPWSDRVESWISGAGCDAWMLFRDTVSPEVHARTWAASREKSSHRITKEWLDYYDSSGITSITSGLLTIRKKNTRKNWFKVDKVPIGKGQCGTSIEAGFRAFDFLEENQNDEDLLASCLTYSPDSRSRKPLAIGDRKKDDYRLQLTRGFVFSASVDELTMTFLENSQGTMTVSEALANTENSLGEKSDREQQLATIRALVAKGFLLPNPT